MVGCTRVMQTFLREHPDLIRIIHMYWTSYALWKPLGDEQQLIHDDVVWKSRRNEFNLLADSFLKHGEGMGYKLDEYIMCTLHCFFLILNSSPIDLLKASNRYPMEDELFGLKLNSDGKLEHQCEAKDIRDVFANSSLSIPKLEFTAVINHRNSHITCTLSEIKWAFDNNLTLIDFLETFCNCPGKSKTEQPVTDQHKVSVFTNTDRSTNRK